MSGALIRLENISRVYRMGEEEVRALDGVSLEIEAGEFVAIMGQSGSGKSTLMNILGCLDRPTSGRYEVAGYDVATLDADELAALRRDVFGFVFQRYNLLADASAAENVEVPAVYAGAHRSERSERARELLARLGLGDRAGHRPGELSGGQQQRVSIARALMNGAEVILADEPTGALDSASGESVLELLKELHADGRTVILITHDANVAAHAHRVIEIHDGRITADNRNGHAAVAAAREQSNVDLARAAPLLAQIGESMRIALRSLRVNLFRTALTLLGVVIGVGAVVTMLAIGDGSKQAVVERIEAMGTNLLYVRPGAPGTRPRGDAVATLTPADARALAELDNVVAVSPDRSTKATVRANGVDYRTDIQGTWASFTQVQDWPLTDGTFISDSDVESYAPVIVLGATVAQNLYPDGGSPVGEFVLVGNIPFEVIGVLSAKGATGWGRDMDDVALVPLSTGFMRLFGQQYLSSISVKVADADRINETEQALKTEMLLRHQTEDFQVRNSAELLEMVTETQDTLTVLLASVAAISLLVGGIGVMNIMLVSVTERTREIGIRMATGARQANIQLQFITEALVVGGIGGLTGVALGLGAAKLAGSFGVDVAFSPTPSVLAFSCAIITGLVFGFLPARKAARLDPVAALASE